MIPTTTRAKGAQHTLAHCERHANDDHPTMKNVIASNMVAFPTITTIYLLVGFLSSFGCIFDVPVEQIRKSGPADGRSEVVTLPGWPTSTPPHSEPHSTRRPESVGSQGLKPTLAASISDMRK